MAASDTTGRIDLAHLDFDGRVTLILVEILESVLKPDASILRIELVSGLAVDETVDLGLHCGRNACKLDRANPNRWRRNRKVHRRNLLGAEVAGEARLYGRLQAFGRQHFLKHLADSIIRRAAGWQKTVIEREARVDFVVQIFTRLERQIVEM